VIHLDHNASAPMLPAVLDAVGQAMRDLHGNPHSPHALGRRARAALDDARGRVGALCGRPARDVLFTSGASEANAWVLGALRRGGAVLTSAVEHPSVRCHASEELPVDGDGVVDLDHLQARLAAGPTVSVVSVMAANNETGVLQPIAEVWRLCRNAGVPLHVDAAQLPGRLPVDIDADFITLSAHKMGGPKGIGALIASRPPEALICGGPQERGVRAGTVAVPLAVGMGEAAHSAGTLGPALRDRMEGGCVQLGGRVLSAGAARLPNTTSLLFDQPGDLLVMALDLEGVAASTGSACASGAPQDSHVVAAMGLSGVPLRLSLGPDTTAADVDAALAALRRVLNRMRGLPPDPRAEVPA